MLNLRSLYTERNLKVTLNNIHQIDLRVMIDLFDSSFAFIKAPAYDSKIGLMNSKDVAEDDTRLSMRYLFTLAVNVSRLYHSGNTEHVTFHSFAARVSYER